VAGQRRDTLLEMLEQFDQRIQPVEQAVKQAAGQPAEPAAANPSRSRSGDLVGDHSDHGEVSRFPDSRSWVSYLGLNPSENSSGMRRRLGGISKQGNPFLRYLLVEGAASAAKGDRIWAGCTLD